MMKRFHTYRDENGGPSASAHEWVQDDPGSCSVPDGQTITLEEWWAQQGESEREGSPDLYAMGPMVMTPERRSDH